MRRSSEKRLPSDASASNAMCSSASVKVAAPRKAGTAVIVGAGPGGLSAAVALRQAGYQVTICERATRLGATGSGLTLWPNATQALDMLGLLPAVAAISRPLSAIVMKSWNGQTIFEDSLISQETHCRFPSLGLLRSDLVNLLSAPVADAIVFDGRVVSVSQSAGVAVARLANGRELTADLLIGADGLHSVIREHVVGVGSLSHAGYTVWRGISRLTFEAAVGTTWVGRGKQFGLFPLRNEQTYWFAASKVRNANSGSNDELALACADAPEPIAEVIARTDTDMIVRTEIYDRPPLPRWSFDRITLLGDAAHPATPALGQGACQAIEDGVTLGACLAGADDIVAALRAYQLRRLRRANAFVIEARRLGRLGLIENRLVCGVRDRVLRSLPTALRQKQLTRMFDFAV